MASNNHKGSTGALVAGGAGIVGGARAYREVSRWHPEKLWPGKRVASMEQLLNMIRPGDIVLEGLGTRPFHVPKQLLKNITHPGERIGTRIFMGFLPSVHGTHLFTHSGMVGYKRPYEITKMVGGKKVVEKGVAHQWVHLVPEKGLVAEPKLTPLWNYGKGNVVVLRPTDPKRAQKALRIMYRMAERTKRGKMPWYNFATAMESAFRENLGLPITIRGRLARALAHLTGKNVQQFTDPRAYTCTGATARATGLKAGRWATTKHFIKETLKKRPRFQAIGWFVSPEAMKIRGWRRAGVWVPRVLGRGMVAAAAGYGSYRAGKFLMGLGRRMFGSEK